MKKAFTLVEIIITLSIIGVIAALTLPSVMKTYRQKVYSAQLKKTVSQIEMAAKTAMSEEHSTDFFSTTAGLKEGTDDSQASRYFLKNYFKISSGKNGSCASLATPCVPASYKTKKGVDAGGMFGYCVQTVNGAVICMWNSDQANNSYIGVDINGTDAPNIVGIDVFGMMIHSDGSVADLSANTSLCGKATGDYANFLKYAQGCFQKVLDNDWKIEE